MTVSKKRSFITGGGSGIGLAIAKALHNAGYDVTIGGRDEAKLKAAGFPYLVVDVTDEASLMAAAREAGDLDLFVANAGAAPTAPTLKTSRALWDSAIAVNLTSIYLCTQAFAPAMIARGSGRFIAIASTASHRAYPYTGAYAAAKHGVLGWMRTMALEHAKSGVTFNTICPGFTDTPLLSGAVDRLAAKSGGDINAAKRALAKDNPMARLVTPEEVAAAVVYLASEAAASVNGQSLIIDGGELIS